MRFFILLLLLFSSHIYAEKFSVSAEMDRKKIALNESFTFSVKVNYKKNKPENIVISDLAQLDDFNVLNQWSGTRTSMNSVNGRIKWTSVYSRNYTLQAKAKGRLRINSIQISVNGQIFKTDPLFIVVTKKTNRSQQPPNFFSTPSSRLLDPLINPLFKRNPFAEQNIPSDKAFQFELNLNKKSVYIGEMIEANWVLWISLGNTQYRDHKIPELKGFWKEQLIERGKSQFIGTQIKNNVLYRKILLDSQALFPVKEGVLTVDSYKVIMMSPSGIQWKKSIKQTESKNVIVKPLPKEGRENFSGGVGSFKVRAFLNQNQTQVNQPVTLHLRFEGQGHPRLIQMPSLSFPKGLKIYPPTEQSKFSAKNKSYKEFEILIAPQKIGLFVLPSFVVTTFNPSLNHYVKHTIPSFTLRVESDLTNAKKDQQSFFDKNDENKDAISSSKEKVSLWLSVKEKWQVYFNQKDLFKFWMMFYSFLILLFAFLYFYSTPFQRKKVLKKKVNLKLKEIEQSIQKNEKSTSVLLTNLIYFVLSELSPNHSSQEWSKLLDNLPPSLHHSFSKKIKVLMQELEDLSFAPKDLIAQSERIQAVFKASRKLVIQMIESC